MVTLRSAVLWAVVGMACAAPISTQRSPMHLRVIELHNDTQRDWVLTIVPTADQHLGAATTFTGRFRPGETKTLYLYHGLRYQVDVLEQDGDTVSGGIYHVDHDIALVFGGDSLRQVPRLAVELGEPIVTFADSVQRFDPFGVRSTAWPTRPDTTGLRGYPAPEESVRSHNPRLRDW